jgi:hypothetical protein
VSEALVLEPVRDLASTVGRLRSKAGADLSIIENCKCLGWQGDSIGSGNMSPVQKEDPIAAL